MTDDLRIGNPDREVAVAALHEAVAGGYLTIAEFDERVAAVYAARTRGDLVPVLGDLPQGSALLPASARPAPDPSVPPEKLSIEWATVRHGSGWTVPPRLEITGSMGTADLDLAAAKFANPAGSQIVINVSMSTVRLRVSPATVVERDRLELRTMSTFKAKRKATGNTGPLLTLLGTVSTTSVVILPSRFAGPGVM